MLQFLAACFIVVLPLITICTWYVWLIEYRDKTMPRGQFYIATAMAVGITVLALLPFVQLF